MISRVCKTNSESGWATTEIRKCKVCSKECFAMVDVYEMDYRSP